MINKFLNKKQILGVSTICILLAATGLSGCSGSAKEQLETMLSTGEKVEISVALPEGAEELQGEPCGWKMLAKLTDQPDLRKGIDNALGIISYGSSKNGVLYVNPETEEWEPNNTLEAVYKNKEYTELMKDEDVIEEISKATIAAYSDIDEKSNPDEVKLAALNGYFNIFPEDDDSGEFNGEAYLTRAEYMSGLAKAHLQAQEGLAASSSAGDQLGYGEYTAYAELVSDNAYLDIKSVSLNSKNFKGLITRAEVAYMLVKTYYADEMDSIESKAKTYSDVKNAGNMSEEAGTTDKKQYKAANLEYMVNNPRKGLDEDLYKAMVVAYNHNIFGNVTESRWNEPITKEEALQSFINVYEDLGTTIKCKNGSSKSISASEIDVNDVSDAYKFEINGKEYTAADFENAGAVLIAREYDTMPPVSYEEWLNKINEMPSGKLDIFWNHAFVQLDDSSEFYDALSTLSNKEFMWMQEVETALANDITDKDEILNNYVLTEEDVDEGLAQVYYAGKLTDDEKASYEKIYNIGKDEVTYERETVAKSTSSKSNSSSSSSTSSSTTQQTTEPSEVQQAPAVEEEVTTQQQEEGQLDMDLVATHLKIIELTLS